MIQKPFGRRSATTLVFFTILACLATISNVADAAYVVSVPAHDEECFNIMSPGTAGGTLHGNYDLLNDELSNEPVSVVIIDANEQHVLYRSRRRSSEGIFKINLKPDQKVSLCLQNGLVTAGRGRKSKSARTHDGEERVIGFEYEVEAKNGNKEIHEQHSRNEKAAIELRRGLLNLINHHQYMRVRESAHREVVETTFSQLMWWAILEGLVVVGIAAVQIIYFRHFLERRRYL